MVRDNGDDSVFKGLVVNDFANGDAFEITADSIKVQGNYIGVDPTGFSAHPNSVGVNALAQTPQTGHDALIGGLSPEDRNIISGNTAGSAGTAGYPGTGWVIQGNYVGLAPDGLTTIPNSTLGGSGAFSIDDCQDVLVGGEDTGATNVIGGNKSHGIAPNNADNVDIVGNFIGLGYDGSTIIDNTLPDGYYGSGLTFGSDSNVTILKNKIAGWSGGGIYIGSGDDSDFSISENEVYDNAHGGINIGGQNNNLTNNSVYNNGDYNIMIGAYSPVQPVASGITLRANKVGLKPDSSPGTNNTGGVYIFGDPTNVLIGGTGANDGNQIAYNKKGGIIVSSFSVPLANLQLDIQKVSIIGNSIYANEPETSGPFASGGLGIDLYTDVDSDGDFTADTVTDTGPTLNDTTDSDTGPNNYINSPVLNSASQESDQATINFNLDAADSPTDQYRVEFFANDTPDTSGFGEGQTYLGSTTVTNGNDQTATITLPSNFKLSGKSISATTTAVDSTTDSGFGSTSEFSAVLNLPDDTTAADSELPGTGENVVIWVLVSVIFSTIGFVRIFRLTIKA